MAEMRQGLAPGIVGMGHVRDAEDRLWSIITYEDGSEYRYRVEEVSA